jgi:non-specific serine/threonine protein kinase
VNSRSQGLGNLPPELTSFVGRRDTTALVKRLLSTSRLVTLTGAGGAGKTRLALHVAREVRRAFPDGAWLVELAALREPALLYDTMAAAFGLRNLSTQPSTEVLEEHLRDKRLLLVLDNCEHLLDDCAHMVTRALRAAPDVQVLATSREPLRAAGEQVWTVGPLTFPVVTNGANPALMGGAAGRQSEALALFEQRAAAVVPGFTVSRDNETTLARLCQRLDGLPLAIELAAARMRILSVEQLLDRLTNSYDLLTVGDRTALPRHQTLQAAVGWSFDLCSELERVIWARLSVFAGSFDLDAAEYVCAGGDRLAGGDDVFAGLAGLVDKSVLAREDHGHAPRYRMLETIRQYGRERLAESGEDCAVRARHRDYYLSLAENADADWFGPHQADWSSRILREQANIRSALDYCLTVEGDAPVGMRLAAALWFFWILSGHARDGRYWLERALAADARPSRERAKALWVAGSLAVWQGDLALARARLDQCISLAQEIGDESALTSARQVLCNAELWDDQWEAVKHQEEVVRYRQQGGAEINAVAVFSSIDLAFSELLIGRIDQALAFCEESQAVCAQHGERWCLSWVLWALAIIHWVRGDARQAAADLRESLRIRQEINDLHGMLFCVEALAWVSDAAGEAKYAACLLGASQALWKSFGRYLSGFQPYLDWHDRCVRQARRTLGDKSFDAECRRGGQFSLDEAVSCALGTTSSPTPPAAASPQPQLTRREQEVAKLVARGLSNKEIANQLIISPRTAEAHVENILAKLGFTSRIQIARWWTD